VKLLKYSSSDVVGIILSIDENHAEEPTVWTCSNQEERCCGKKTLAYIDFQSVLMRGSDNISQKSKVVDNTPA